MAETRLEDMTEPELAKFMRTLAAGIEHLAQLMGVEKPHFALIVFNDPALGQYISNCTRESMIEAFRETADRIEKNQDITRIS